MVPESSQQQVSLYLFDFVIKLCHTLHKAHLEARLADPQADMLFEKS